MPAYRNITINLVSQFDILNIPEYAPPAPLDDPFAAPPAPVDKSLVSCYIPIYPLSQFWLSYSISAPHPPKALYYFKLFINGACVVSWGCGEENGFKGKTTYGLFDSGERWMGEPGVDVRAFTFACGASKQHPMHSTPGRVMEVRVYRSRGRKRIRPELESFKAIAARSDNRGQPPQSKNSKGQALNLQGGVRYMAAPLQRRSQSAKRSEPSMLNAGVLPDDHPRRFYTYYLLDPLDQPFATFRWYYRTWRMSHSTSPLANMPLNSITLAQLEALGVTRPLPGPRKTEADPQQLASHPNDGFGGPATLNPSPPSSPRCSPDQTASPILASDNTSPLTIRGLSLPAIPLIDLPPPLRESRPSSPIKKGTKSARLASGPGAAAVSQSRFAQLVRGSSRSPSPPKVDDDSMARPVSPVRLLRRTASMGALVGAVQNAMRRHGRGSQDGLEQESVEKVVASVACKRSCLKKRGDGVSEG